ncbi:hypothetical protein A1Q1_01881 [Trichosporon asahii var. asahii CBS 2479]|uniref:GED domain-containing protein n=1 Tax=Trichosporon asahii var. asahii (strain ATCC 90039 / CBS 2479 / JCM 2466 / KCTC 7840 / NBRC 103889/ NCYC 2677 / UAMH 7654) TaxID=1186058 RepID=J4UD84_TRIAS|nr:hypothetical protein A1Q1_01881 [Trichosporon asahii var. asahii CBS 2479]EJT49050.1 hypothetical protein A1Q1_01881 [Trichosporon asahii var. asahii CBS 2479]
MPSRLTHIGARDGLELRYTPSPLSHTTHPFVPTCSGSKLSPEGTQHFTNSSFSFHTELTHDNPTDTRVLDEELTLHGSEGNLDHLASRYPSIQPARNSYASCRPAALDKIPLHSDVDTATLYGNFVTSADGHSGPAEIHSRWKNAPFSATIQIEHLFKDNGKTEWRRQSFTTLPITNKEELQCALRPYEQLLSMDEEEIGFGAENLAQFTFNKIILWRDISAIDLPGRQVPRKPLTPQVWAIATGNSWQGSTIKFSTARSVWFAALTQDDPQLDLPVVSAVKRARPQMERVLAILTKVDKVESVARTAWGKMVAGSYEAMDSVRPEHGYHPLYLKTADMYEDGMSKEDWLETQADFFQRPEIQRWAQKCGRALGWAPTSEKIYALFADLVEAQVPVIKNRIEFDLEHTRQDISKLPPQVDNPSSLLHDGVIAPVTQDLAQSFEKRCSRILQLLTPLQDLQVQLAQSIEDAYPLKDVKVRDKVSTAWAAQALTSQEKHLFTIIHSKLHDPRDDEVMSGQVGCPRLDSQRSGMGRSEQHGGRGRWERRWSSPSHSLTRNDLRRTQESAVSDYIGSIMSKELERQDLIDDNSLLSQEAAEVVNLCAAEFVQYCVLFGGTIDLTDDVEPPESKKFFDDIYPAEGTEPIEWPKAYKDMCIETAALVHHRLTKAARRVHEELLREINHRMLRFIKETPASLRTAFELDAMSPEKKRKLSELCDVSKEVAEKRTKLLDQQKNLLELQDLMRTGLDN